MIKLAPLILEMSDFQKELKKDYLFKQSKLHSSNTVPEWKVIWKNIQNSEGFARELEYIRDDTESRGKEFDERQAIEDIEDQQRHKYFELVQEYKNLDGEKCWREIYLPKNVDPRRLPQLGIYWAISDSAAEAHWGHKVSKKGPAISCVYEATIDLHVIDWAGTMFARMDMTLGDDEQEIRFLKNARLYIHYVKVWDDMEGGNSRVYQINDYRRA